jgi:hypothetical protein
MMDKEHEDYIGDLEDIPEDKNPSLEDKTEQEIDEGYDSEGFEDISNEASQTDKFTLGVCYRHFNESFDAITYSYAGFGSIMDGILLHGQDENAKQQIQGEIEAIKTAYNDYRNILTELVQRPSTQVLTEATKVLMNNVLAKFQQLEASLITLTPENGKNSLSRFISRMAIKSAKVQNMTKQVIEELLGKKYSDKNADFVQSIYVSGDALVSAEELTEKAKKDYGIDPDANDLSTNLGGKYFFQTAITSLMNSLYAEHSLLAQMMESRARKREAGTKIEGSEGLQEDISESLEEEDLFYDAEESLEEELEFHDAENLEENLYVDAENLEENLYVDAEGASQEEIENSHGKDKKQHAENANTPQQTQDKNASELTGILKILAELKKRIQKFKNGVQQLSHALQEFWQQYAKDNLKGVTDGLDEATEVMDDVEGLGSMKLLDQKDAELEESKEENTKEDMPHLDKLTRERKDSQGSRNLL